MTLAQFPAHASPALGPIAYPRPTHYSHHHKTTTAASKFDRDSDFSGPPLVSPAFTPPRTPSATDVQKLVGDGHALALPDVLDADDRRLRQQQQQHQHQQQLLHEQPQLLDRLPEVTCQVRARIPTTSGTEMWLHLYHNNVDDKEHLAIVFGPNIRSRSLDAPREGETERDRMIRGAYVGTLYPGRTSSRVERIRQDAGVSSIPPSPDSTIYQPDATNNHPSSSASSSSSPSPASSSYFETRYPAHLGPPLVRIHSECYTGETVWSARCDCGEQLDEAARLMSMPIPSPHRTPDDEHNVSAIEQKLPPCGGVIIYLRQEGRGIGLLSKLKAYNLQDLGHDTMEANILLRHPGDARSYGLATAMLLDLGLGGERGIKLLTNNPEKVRAVEGPNREVRVVQRVPMIPLAWKTGGKEGVHGPEVEKYISTKIEKFKHMFTE